MIRLLNVILFLQFLISVENPILTDTLHNNIQSILNFENNAKEYSSKIDKVNYYEDVSITIYNKTLNLEKNTKDMILEYTSLINSLENRLKIKETSISYDLGAPFIRVHFKQIPINRKNIRNNLHFNQANTLKDQYLDLVRYYHKTIDICENRVDELLNMLDKTSLDRLIEDIIIEKHLIVMNFANINKNDKFDKLSTVFPDMIINRYKNRDDIQVNYSGKIDPDLRKIPQLNQDVDKYLIDGKFEIDGYDIKVTFKIYDVNSWVLLNSDILICDIRDLDCIYDNFLWKLKNTIDPIVNFENYSDFKNDDKKIISKVQLDSIAIIKRNDNLFAPILEDFAVQKDYSFDIMYKDLEIGQSESSKTQTFDLSKHPNGILTRKELQENLLKKVNNFLLNPYQIDIGKLDMNLNNLDASYVDLDISISYKINKRDFEKNIKKMPYNSLKSKTGSNTYEFLNENYLFDNNFSNMINKHDKELFPVLFFTNKEGNIQKIIIDSWDDRYDNIMFGDYDVERQNKFVQMFSVINDDGDIQINLSSKKQIIDYKVIMPVSILDNYTQVTVKVFNREDLDAYLPINELGF